MMGFYVIGMSTGNGSGVDDDKACGLAATVDDSLDG